MRPQWTGEGKGTHHRGGLGTQRRMAELLAQHARMCTHVSCSHDIHLCEQRRYSAGMDNPLSGDPDRVTWSGNNYTALMQGTAPNLDECDGRRWSSVRVHHWCSNTTHVPHPSHQGRAHCHEAICTNETNGALCAMEPNGACTCIENRGYATIQMCANQVGPNCLQCDASFHLEAGACEPDVDVPGIKVQIADMMAQGDWNGAADCGCAGAGAAIGCSEQRTIAVAAANAVAGLSAADVTQSLDDSKTPGTVAYDCADQSGCLCASAKVRTKYVAVVEEVKSWL